jgi:hypothetical protein
MKFGLFQGKADTRAMQEQAAKPAASDYTIWLFAFGYFAAYVPYSATTKAVSKGWIDGQSAPIPGDAILALSVAASVVGMFVFLTIMGWWKYAGRVRVLGFDLPGPNRYTFISGLLTAGIVATTTLAYTFKGVSIVFIMLLMRGGVLIIAPMVDAISGRKTRWFSWVGLALSLLALVVAFSADSGWDITLACAIDVAVYLFCYFVRLRFMSRFAKSSVENANVRYFVEEQIVATPATLIVLILVAFMGPVFAGPDTGFGALAAGVRLGFTDIFTTSAWPWVIFIGICSQFTGIFGGLILLDKRENTYCVPVNRSSSILAGVIASFALYAIFSEKGAGVPSGHDLAGAALIIAAILFLTFPPMLEKARAKKAAG